MTDTIALAAEMAQEAEEDMMTGETTAEGNTGHQGIALAQGTVTEALPTHKVQPETSPAMGPEEQVGSIHRLVRVANWAWTNNGHLWAKAMAFKMVDIIPNDLLRAPHQFNNSSNNQVYTAT